MSTPLRSVSLLKKAKHLSPLSKNVLSPASVPSAATSSIYRNEDVSRKLFSKSFLSVYEDLSPSKRCLSPENGLKQLVSQKLVSYQNCLAVPLDTPNKQSLLKHGILENKMFNILGKGSFGTVVKCIYEGKTVAVKVEKMQDENNFAEMNGLNLNHENIVRTFDIILNEMENFALIIMEYSPDSKNLQSMLDDDQNIIVFTQDIIKGYSLSIAKGLVYLHERDIIHLDIKPRNILVCDGVCKICDFGNSVKLPQLPAAFKYQGTVAYTDPEILMGRMPTKKSDIYSLGILLWQMKYRRIPYSNLDNNDLVIYKVVKYNLRPDSELVERNSKDPYSKIYSTCWYPNPKSRPEAKTVLEMLEKLP